MLAVRFIAVLALLFAQVVIGAPKAELWPFWDVSNSSSKQVVDHSDWQRFLEQYLVQDDDGINKLAYKAVSVADQQALLDYLEALAAQDPRLLNKREQLAYWINLYNALTVKVVLDHPQKSSILTMGRGLFAIGPWDTQLVTVAGKSLTLNDIEHRILRPVWQDHRIHYAVNCASIGCPDLAATPYTAANVESLLAQGEHNYINHDRGVAFDGKGRLRVSKIFDWYRDDFAGSDRELLRYLADHHATLSEQIAQYDSRIKYRYDWALNVAND